jgi:molybdopterin converting factor small subunit
MNAFVTLKLFATLKKYRPDSPDRFAIAPGTKVRELVELLGIPPQDVKLVFVDGQQQSLDLPLTGGERVGLFPPVGGG